VARKLAKTIPDWSSRIFAFRQALKLTQGELGKRLRTSAMAVSRWERGDAAQRNSGSAEKILFSTADQRAGRVFGWFPIESAH